MWNGAIRASIRKSSVVPNNGSGAGSPLDTIETSRRAPMLAADRQARHGLAAPWLVGKSAKEYRATMGDKPVIGLFGIGLEEPYRWKDSVTSNAEIRIWALDAMANGMRPWCSKFSGTLHDERWLRAIEEHLRVDGEEPALPCGAAADWRAWGWCIRSRRRGTTAMSRRGKVENYALGWYQALVESRIPFEMVHDRLLDAEHLAELKTLILPNIAALSDAQCEQLRAFVAEGGSVWRRMRRAFTTSRASGGRTSGWPTMFGVDWTGKREGPMLNSYIRLEHEALPRE